MRMHDKVAVQTGPCPLCRRELKLDSRGRPWAHKCPHGLKCKSMKHIGLPGIPCCAECEILKEKAHGKGD